MEQSERIDAEELETVSIDEVDEDRRTQRRKNKRGSGKAAGRNFLDALWSGELER